MRTRTRWTTSAAVPLLLLALVTLPAIASIEKANPEDVGLSTDRLERIHDAIQRHIDDGNITGAVTAAPRRGARPSPPSPHAQPGRWPRRRPGR